MKKASFIGLSFIFIITLSVISNASNFKQKFNKQMIINRGMAVTSIMILNWFKDHPEYKNFDSIKDRVSKLFKDLDKAKNTHFTALKFAKQGNYQKAYEYAKEEWSYLNDIAVKGKKTQDDLMELLKKGEGSGSEE